MCLQRVRLITGTASSTLPVHWNDRPAGGTGGRDSVAYF